MRKLLFLSALVSLLLTTSTGCLKDKEFENQRYGIQGNEVKGISFPEKLKSPLPVGIVSQTTPQTIDGPLLALDAEDPAAVPINVTIALDNSLVTAAGLTILPAGSFSVPSLTVAVPAGSRVSDAIKLTFANAGALDATNTYGVGFKITAVDQGYTIARNMSSIVMAINIKNKYDGEYQAKGYLYHPSAPRAINEAKDVITINATTSQVFLGDLGAAGYVAWFTVDPVTNAVTITPAPSAAGAPYTQFNSGLPNSNPGYTAAWAGSAESNNTYDPATKTFYVRYGYMGGTGWRVTEEHITLK